jgi:hypothetical protein
MVTKLPIIHTLDNQPSRLAHGAIRFCVRSSPFRSGFYGAGGKRPKHRGNPHDSQPVSKHKAASQSVQVADQLARVSKCAISEKRCRLCLCAKGTYLLVGQGAGLQVTTASLRGSAFRARPSSTCTASCLTAAASLPSASVASKTYNGRLAAACREGRSGKVRGGVVSRRVSGRRPLANSSVVNSASPGNRTRSSE